MDRNDSDDDSLDLDNMERMSDDMEVIRREDRAKKPLVVSVSAALANVAAGCTVYVYSFPRPGTVFYAKAGFFKRVIKMACQRRKLVNSGEDCTWVETISSLNLRAKEFGEPSTWLKTSSGNTTDVI